MKTQKIISIDNEIAILMNSNREINWSKEINEFLKSRLGVTDLEKPKDQILRDLKIKRDIYANKVKEYDEAFNKRKLTAPLEEFDAIK